MFEIWQDGKLPEEMQKRIDTAFEQGCETSEACGYFKAGFMCSERYEDFRKEQENDDE